MKLSIAENKQYFLRNDQPFFLLADTAWQAFYKLTLEEWTEYLIFRKRQGFNTLQIVFLPFERPKPNGLYPFKVMESGKYDFDTLEDRFFDKVAVFMEKATEYDFQCVIPLLWTNFTPDTECSTVNKYQVLPADAVEAFIERAVGTLKRFSPIYMLSGDTDFNTAQTARHTEIALRTVRRLDPEAYVTLHLYGEDKLNEHSLPFAKELDYYTYQTGHRLKSQHLNYELAEYFCGLPDKKPVMNAEPCYEGMGYIEGYGRHTDFEVRKAFWQSVLSGAKAGFAYGAYGTYWFQKHDPWATFNPTFDTAFEWRDALRFRGASDICYAKWLYEHYEMHQLQPANDLVQARTDEIRVAATEDKTTVVVYVPYSTHVTLNLELSENKVEVMDLQERYVYLPELRTEGTETKIKMHPHHSDILIIATTTKDSLHGLSG